MFKDKTLRAILFGDTAELVKPETRGQSFRIPATQDGEKQRVYNYRKDDGFVLTLIKMIEKLEGTVKSVAGQISGVQKESARNSGKYGELKSEINKLTERVYELEKKLPKSKK